MIRRTVFVAALFAVVNLHAAGAAPKQAVKGDPEAGKEKTAVCTACHGADGNSAAATFPKLAGQNARYLEKQMLDIKEGRRNVALMTGLLNGWSDQDIKNVAEYYATQVGSVGYAKAELVEKGESIYRSGVAKKGVAACAACHGAQGEGNSLAGFPKLGGQHADYIASQLKAFRTAAEEPEKGRANDGETRIMRDVAASMSDLDIESVSSYIQGLH